MSEVNGYNKTHYWNDELESDFGCSSRCKQNILMRGLGLVGELGELLDGLRAKDQIIIIQSVVDLLDDVAKNQDVIDG